jgi:hypothetical protein
LLPALIVTAHSAHQSATGRPHRCALACISGDRADGRANRGAPGRAAKEPALLSLGWRGWGRSHRVVSGLLLSPGLTGPLVGGLLLRSLTFVRKHVGGLGERERWGKRECRRQSEPKNESFHDGSISLGVAADDEKLTAGLSTFLTECAT